MSTHPWRISLAAAAIALVSSASIHAAGDLKLIEAVRQGDRAAVRSLLGARVDVNASQPDGATALAWAAHRDDVETADLLIRARADVDAANEYGASPLWLAAAKGSAVMTAKLLSAGANPNSALLSGETPLMAAVATGNIDVVTQLLAHGADVNARENHGEQTALMWAVADGHPEIARLLLDRGADVRATSAAGLTPFLLAVQQGDAESARMLLAAGADVNASAPDGRSPLLMASAGGHEPLAVLLLSKGGNPNAADRLGQTVLHHAAAGGKLELVKALLGSGVDPNVRVLHERPNSGPSSLVDYPPVSLIGATPLFVAAEAGEADIVRWLAAHGGDPEMPTNLGTTPLIVAAGAGVYQDFANERVQADWQKRHTETGKALVELGVDVNAAGENGWTALHATAYMGTDDLIPLLVARGAKMDAMDSFGQTPLSIANGVITVQLGDHANRRSRNTRRGTSDILLKLGATPLEESGVQISVKKATGTEAP